MEIKFLGMIFVLLGSFGIGIFYRIRYGNRLHNMQDCERALLILQGEMEYGHTPLMEACEEVSVRRAGRVGKIRWYTRISGFGNAGFNHSDLCTPLKTENGANGKRKP